MVEGPRSALPFPETVDLVGQGPILDTLRRKQKRRQAMIDARLLEILVCPACKTKVRPEGDCLVCQKPGCGLRYPVRDDIPVMLVEEAEKQQQTPNGKQQ
jgi:uncharacterized protein YbaR (Trm112 family)